MSVKKGRKAGKRNKKVEEAEKEKEERNIKQERMMGR
jgi:hypothetical protein